MNRHCGVHDAVDVARWFRPNCIHGPVSLLHIFALNVQEVGENGIRPRVVTCGSEMLPLHTEKLLKETFGAPVFSLFGSWEFGIFMTTCMGRGGYHVGADNVIVECLKDGTKVSPGESGNLVVTNLTSRVMPYIRYNLGDIVEPGQGECGCGHPGPWLHRILGREEDLIHLSDGRTLASYEIIYPMLLMDEILQYRIRQTAPDSFCIEYTAHESLPARRVSEISEYFKGNVGARIVTTERVDAISPEPSGKLRKVIPYQEP